MVDSLIAYRINKLNLFLFIALSLLTAFFTFNKSGERYDIVVLGIFFLISVFSLFGTLISIDTKSYSLNKSFCLFFYFFFSLAPIVQFKNKTIFFLKDYLTTEIYLTTACILLIILLLYLVFYNVMFKYLKRKEYVIHNLKFNSKFSYKNHLKVSYILAIFSVLIVLYLMKWEMSLLIFRPFSYGLKNNTNLGLFGYSLLLIFRLIPFIVLLNYKIGKEKNDRNTFFFLLIVLLICFPTSMSRGLVAIIYIPLVILFFPLFKRGINYVLLFIIGVLFVFPLFNNFRYLKEGILKLNFELFNSAHFDAFQNMALVINENIITSGKQLVGSFLFFVQESQWPNKPNGSGHLLGETVGYSYLNVSMPYFGEGYVNWGYLGIFFFLLFIVLINTIGDSLSKKGSNFILFVILYLLFLGFEFYLMRGDLYSSIKIFSSFLLAVVVVYFTFLINSKLVNKIN